MRVSIVTTTLNALQYVAETVRSVLQTPHGDLEYLIVDAGSSDGTLEFLHSLNDARVRVEVLAGAHQYEAIDWALRRSTGDVMAWLNADDVYFPWTIACISHIFTQFPQVDWITGLPAFLNHEGHCTLLAKPSSYPGRYIRNGWFSEFAFGNLVQESMFWRRDLYLRAGGLNLNYELAGDFELWTRFARHASLEAIDVPLSAWRKHVKNRSVVGAAAYKSEVAKASSQLPPINRLKRWLCRSTATKHALRLMEWHRSPWIYYSLTQARWMRGTAFRPISRYSVQYLKREFDAVQLKTLEKASSSPARQSF
ncbi:MAG: glycosyltransferase [Terracidiphilus sp.]|nr:glycosyltransferase [Terracidiphilus sp.]